MYAHRLGCNCSPRSSLWCSPLSPRGGGARPRDLHSCIQFFRCAQVCRCLASFMIVIVALSFPYFTQGTRVESRLQVAEGFMEGACACDWAALGFTLLLALHVYCSFRVRLGRMCRISIPVTFLDSVVPNGRAHIYLGMHRARQTDK